jgi:radical SAM protein with 4Fe4S-binding SPASM domain
MRKSQTEPYISTYLHAKGRQMGLPIAGNFELTARCNFRCPMCYVHLSEGDVQARGQELSAAQWLQIAREARDRGMMFVLLTGGEPFVRKDFFEILHGMQDLGLYVSINSNGSMLSGEIRRKLLERPPFRMNISLYGGCNETYESMCGQPAYSRVKENIRALREAGVDVSINLSITAYNRQDLEKIYADAVELGVNVKASAYMYPSVRVNGERYGCGDRLSPEEAAACSVRWDEIRFTKEEFQARAERMKELTAVEEPACPVETDEGVRCRAGSTSFWMTWDGRMLPCGMLPHEGAKPLEVGFEAAWQAVRNWTKEIRLPKECQSCDHKELCAVCAAVTVTETGRFDAVPEYVCRQTKAVVQQMQRRAKERRNEDAD